MIIYLYKRKRFYVRHDSLFVHFVLNNQHKRGPICESVSGSDTFRLNIHNAECTVSKPNQRSFNH